MHQKPTGGHQLQILFVELRPALMFDELVHRLELLRAQQTCRLAILGRATRLGPFVPWCGYE